MNDAGDLGMEEGRSAQRAEHFSAFRHGLLYGQVPQMQGSHSKTTRERRQLMQVSLSFMGYPSVGETIRKRMGPLRFELRSEDPQSPRMARLPYGPVLLLLDRYHLCILLYTNAVTARSGQRNMQERCPDSGISAIFFFRQTPRSVIDRKRQKRRKRPKSGGYTVFFRACCV